jgi:uncharacterized protein (TIGR00299 family) protein
MKILHFDVIGGASGDMILGALVDSGLPVDVLRTLLEQLQLNEFEINSQKVTKNGFSATKVNVAVQGDPPERHLKDIREIIQRSKLQVEIQDKSLAIFQRIAEVEAAIHHQPVAEVHLHELGGTDTIIDITGTLLALDYLGITAVSSSPLPLGKGFVKGAHGEIPLPAPATVGLLKGLPVYGTDIQAELVTPTGAAIISQLSTAFGPAPAMELETTGYGAGNRDLPIPNLLRILIGKSKDQTRADLEQLTMLETNLDDLNPEIYPYLMDRLFEAGALDVVLLPIQMKKNRPGTQVQVLAKESDVGIHKSILFQETTTLGIREYRVDRVSLPRKILELDTAYGKIRVKIADINDHQKKVSPEYEDCARAAKEFQVPLQLVYREVIDFFNKNHSETLR